MIPFFRKTIVFRVVPCLLILAISCTKKVGKNTALAYSDQAILDSCAKTNHVYYKNNAGLLLPGSAGPHGNFKLRFNAIAIKALTDNGKLPAGKTMPDGSLVIKDVYSGANVALYAYMYKVGGSWLWGEIKTNREVLHSVNLDHGVCTSCHSQAGNRDLIMSFYFY